MLFWYETVKPDIMEYEVELLATKKYESADSKQVAVLVAAYIANSPSNRLNCNRKLPQTLSNVHYVTFFFCNVARDNKAKRINSFAKQYH